MGNSESQTSMDEIKASGEAESEWKKHHMNTTTQTKSAAAVAAVPLAHDQYDTIVRSVADWAVERNIPIDKLHEKLYGGVLLNQKREKLWIDKNSNKNCFMLLARNLSITWAEYHSYWQWKTMKEETPCSDDIEVAELTNVCWLDIHGTFNISKLSPDTIYEVLFVMMLKEPAYGWEVPVNYRLILPDRWKLETQVTLLEKPRGRWIEVPAGEFKTPKSGLSGKIDFSVYEYGGHLKRGLLLKGVLIQPAK